MTPATPLVFKPSPSRTAGRRIFGAVLVAGGVLVGGVLFLVGLVLVPLFLEGARTNHAALWGLMVPVTGLLIAVVLAVFGGVMIYAGTRDEVRLTGESITLTNGNRTTTLQLAEIASLGIHFVRDSPRVGHWTLVIASGSGATIELGIAQGAYLAMFDVQPIVKTLLPRLSAGVRVDERVRQYAESGLGLTA